MFGTQIPRFHLDPVPKRAYVASLLCKVVPCHMWGRVFQGVFREWLLVCTVHTNTALCTEHLLPSWESGVLLTAEWTVHLCPIPRNPGLLVGCWGEHEWLQVAVGDILYILYRRTLRGSAGTCGWFQLDFVQAPFSLADFALWLWTVTEYHYNMSSCPLVLLALSPASPRSPPGVSGMLSVNWPQVSWEECVRCWNSNSYIRSGQCCLCTEKSAVYLRGVKPLPHIRASKHRLPSWAEFTRVTDKGEGNACIFHITLGLPFLPCIDYVCHQLKIFITSYYLQNKG